MWHYNAVKQIIKRHPIVSFHGGMPYTHASAHGRIYVFFANADSKATYTLHDDAMHVMSPRTNMLRRFICRDNFYLYSCILLESTCKYDHIPVYLLLYQLLYVKIMLELCYCIVSLSSGCFLVTAKRS